MEIVDSCAVLALLHLSVRFQPFKSVDSCAVLPLLCVSLRFQPFKLPTLEVVNHSKWQAVAQSGQPHPTVASSAPEWPSLRQLKGQLGTGCVAKPLESGQLLGSGTVADPWTVVNPWTRGQLPTLGQLPALANGQLSTLGHWPTLGQHDINCDRSCDRSCDRFK